VASERQIVANRLNARGSTGPRSHAGKRRASRNAYRHGLALSVYANERIAKQIDDMARRFVGDVEDGVCLQLARTVAEGQLTVARVRQAKALIESVRASSPSTNEPESSMEAIRRALPDLVKLDRYERRAISRRDTAFLKLVEGSCLRD
jgi:hypothetical protein